MVFLKQIKKICVFGGDKRQRYIAEMLCPRGVETVSKSDDISKEKLSVFDCFLLPVPVTRDGYRLGVENDILLMDLFEALPYECTVIGGKIPRFFADHLITKDIQICDFYEDKEYIWKNAKITAEGALMLLMSESEFSLEGVKALVCGYGRIGKCLSEILGAHGVDVTVAARKKEVLLEATIFGGFETEHIEYSRVGSPDTHGRYDVIFNTIPSRIFDDENASILENSIYIELASAPYGGDGETIEKYCKKYILASGLPGKYAPQSDAEEAFKAISRHIFEEKHI